jgi:thiol:disulfide interchange protein
VQRGFLVLGMILMIPGFHSPAQTSPQQSHSYSPVKAFDPSRDAAKDIREAVSEARRTGRRVLLDVGGDWCVWCRRLDSLFESHPDLEKYRDEHYVTVKVNWSKENKNEKVLSAYPKIPGYPHLFVLRDDGVLLHSQDTSELERGKGHDPEKVMAFLKRWAPDQRRATQNHEMQ